MARLKRKKSSAAKKKFSSNSTKSVEEKKLLKQDKSRKPAIGSAVKNAQSKRDLTKKGQGRIGFYTAKTSLFLREVKNEFKKVTWPSRKQTIGSTVVVIIMVMIISLFLGVVDYGLANLIQIVLQ